MIRLLVVATAITAVLAGAPAALASTFVVNDNGDAGDATAQTACTSAIAGCTLRAAILAANANTGADTITFDSGGQAPAPATALPAVTDPVSIDGGGTVAVTFAPAATGNLLDLQAANSLVKSISLSGGDANATVVNLGASGDRLDTVTVHDTPGIGIQASATSTRVDSPQVTRTGSSGIRISGDSVTVTSPAISSAAADGIAISGSGATISGGQIHNNSGNGVAMSGQMDTVTHVVFYGNGGKPIADAPGANGAVAPPQNLRIGPRRADGSLPLTGSGSSGTIELWSGDPSSGAPPAFLDSFHIGGDFTYNFAHDPTPGQVFALSLTGDSIGTSEFATVTTPQDISSPDATAARALDTNNVRVDFTEPLDPNSVQASDFQLNMAGLDRPITGVTVSPDGRYVVLASSGWRAGEAGILQMAGPGAVTDTAGNAMLTAPRLRVAAAPGDFIAPIGGSLSVSPKTICLTHARTCRRPGMVISFTSTEAGKGTLVIKRSDVTIGERLYGKIVAGKNKLHFNGVLGARKLRAGRYRLLMYVQDQVGNVTDNPPIVLFNVRRVSR